MLHDAAPPAEEVGASFAVPSGGFPVILADPPWTFADRGTRLAPSYAGPQRKSAAPYRVMGMDGVCALGSWVLGWAAPSSFLFLWAPNALVVDGTATNVARAWGFEPKQLIPWVKTDAAGKPRLGGGHYTRVCTEQLLLCRRGRAAVRSRSVPGVILAPRTAHSAKPDASYRLIEQLVDGPYLELFARRRFGPAWSVWGDQAPAEAAP